MPHDSSARAFSSKLERKEVGQAAQLEAFVHILGDRCYMETVGNTRVCTLGRSKTNFEKSQSPPAFSGP